MGVLVFAPPIAAEQWHHILLETDASYQLEFSFKNQLDGQPPILSIYTYNAKENESLLNMTRLYQGLPGDDVIQASLIFEPSFGQQRADILLQVDDRLNETLTIRRLPRLDLDSITNLAEMIFNQQLYTGLIVDARGLELERGISPRIFSETGQLIYGGVTAPYEFIQTKGVLSYGHSISPELIRRVSIPGKISYSSPLVIEAEEVIGSTKTEVVISQESAEVILAAIQKYDFFAQYAVAILID